MKDWSLRKQLTLWSALLIATILVVVAGGVAFYLQQLGIAQLDQQLQRIGAHFLTEYRENGARPQWVTPRAVESVITETAAEGWFIEITDTAGRSLYASRSLAGRSLAGAPPGISDFDLGEDGVRIGAFSEGGITLRIAADLDDLNELSSSLLIAVALVFPAILAILFFGSRWLAARALTPVGELTAAAERVTAQRLRERLPVPPTGDELARLATVLNATFDRLAAAFAQASRFSADASHEFKTPLAVARAGLESLRTSPTLSAHDHDAIADVLDQLRRVSNITQTLLLLSRADGGQLGVAPTVGDLGTLLRACVEDAEVAADARHITITTDAPVNVPACFDAERTTLVLQNLLENAVKYNRDGGNITVNLSTERGLLTIEIANTGPGIRHEHRAQLFARFFRAAAPAETPGHGLGLSLARELARAQGGDILLGTSGNAWTAFVFTLPA